MARARKIETGWGHEVDGEEQDFRVVLGYTPGTPDRGADFGCAGGYPGDPAEVEILEVREDKPNGALRPDLLAAAQAQIDTLADKAIEEDEDFDRGAEEDRWEWEREDAMFGGRL